MKNSFPRFVFVALLSTAAGMVFGTPPKIGAEANQGNIGIGKMPISYSKPRDDSYTKQDSKLDGSNVYCAPATVKLEDSDSKIQTRAASEICRTVDLNGVRGTTDNAGFDSVDAAVLAAAQSVQNNQCQITRDRDPGDKSDAGVGVEVHINGYERSGSYYYGDSRWFSDNSIAAKSAPSDSENYSRLNLKHVFSFHNHPNTHSGWRSDFFSVADWNSAQANNVPSYMMTCFLEGGSTTPRMLRLDPKTGNVHERHVNMSADGKLAYEGGWSETPIYNFNGVLGWCACKRGSFEKLELMGIPLVSIKDMEECCDICGEIFGEEWYVKDEFKRAHEEVSWCGWKGAVYYLCVECGKACKDLCIRPEGFPAYAEKLAKLVKSQNKQGVKELKMQSADFRRVSDGEIVVRGVCECSSPHEIRANFWTHVCKACGRLVLNPKEK